MDMTKSKSKLNLKTNNLIIISDNNSDSNDSNKIDPLSNNTPNLEDDSFDQNSDNARFSQRKKVRGENPWISNQI